MRKTTVSTIDLPVGEGKTEHIDFTEFATGEDLQALDSKTQGNLNTLNSEVQSIKGDVQGLRGEVQSLRDDVAGEVYTKEEIDEKFEEVETVINDVTSGKFYTKTEVDEAIEEVAYTTARAFNVVKDTLGADDNLKIKFEGTRLLNGATSVKQALLTVDSSIGDLQDTKADFERGSMDPVDLHAWYAQNEGIDCTIEELTYNIVGDYCFLGIKNMMFPPGRVNVYYSIPIECVIPSHGYFKSAGSNPQSLYWSISLAPDSNVNVLRIASTEPNQPINAEPTSLVIMYKCK